MRLIDADKLQAKHFLQRSEYPTRYEGTQAVYDYTDILTYDIESAKTVEAIPIKWIKNYASHKASKDLIDCYWHFWEDDVLKMVSDWKKENEKRYEI